MRWKFCLFVLLALVACQKNQETAVEIVEPKEGTTEAYLASQVQKILDQQMEFYNPDRGRSTRRQGADTFTGNSDCGCCPVPVSPDTPATEPEAPPIPTPTPTATPEPTPTSTPEPSPTATPSESPSPSPTPDIVKDEPVFGSASNGRMALGDPSPCGRCVYLCLRDAAAACQSVTSCIDACAGSSCRQANECNTFYGDCMRKAETNMMEAIWACGATRRECIDSRPRPLDGIDYWTCQIPYVGCIDAASEMRGRQRLYCRQKKQLCEDAQ